MCSFLVVTFLHLRSMKNLAGFLMKGKLIFYHIFPPEVNVNTIDFHYSCTYILVRIINLVASKIEASNVYII